MVVIFVAFAMQFCPWMLVDRCTFIYHFFTSVPFIILMIVYCMSCLLESSKLKLYNGVLFVTGVGVILGIVALSYSKVKFMLPLAIILVVSSLVAYLLERYSDKLVVRFGIPVCMTAGAIVSIELMPCLVPIFAAMLLASFMDFVVKAKHREFRGVSILICYLALVVGLFVSFYPALSGMRVSSSYIKSLQWLGSWYF